MKNKYEKKFDKIKFNLHYKNINKLKIKYFVKYLIKSKEKFIKLAKNDLSKKEIEYLSNNIIDILNNYIKK